MDAATYHRFGHSDRRGAILSCGSIADSQGASGCARVGLYRYRGDRSDVARRARFERGCGEAPMTIALMLFGMLALAVLNVPIAIALGFVAMIAILVIQGAYMLPNLALVMYDGASSFPL